jgi:sarcosine oxidase
METIAARNVVIGAGAVGSAAAYHLARLGEPVLLLEQFAIGHSRGSSHGMARITRHSYDNVAHARLMIDAFRGWRALEADAGVPLYVRSGGVSICPAGVDYVANVAASLAEIGVDHRLMTGRELRRALPMFATPDDHVAVFEPDAGLLAASRIVEAQVALARDRGADVREGGAVRSIDLEGERPIIVGDGLRVTAERLIVAAGAWVGRLLPDVAATLVPTRQQVLYFRPLDATTFAVGRFPVWIYMGAAEEEAFYGMPDFLGGGAKAARHFGPQTDPDVPESHVGETYIEGVRTFLRGQIPALAEAPLAAAEVCLYTMSPDSLFVVGRWGTRDDVFIASPCSGHGFKFSNLVGRALAELARDGSTTVPIGPWAPGRFARVP